LETQLDRLDSIRLHDIGISVENVNVVVPQASNFEELMDLIDFSRPTWENLKLVTRPYLRTFDLSIKKDDDEVISYLCCSPLMSYFLANCSEVAIDATYNEINVPGNEIYLLNVVGYSEDLQRWIPGPRYRLNGKQKMNIKLD